MLALRGHGIASVADTDRVATVDEPNAQLVAATRGRADLIVDMASL
jgi:hypothetical protein